ncbi:MDR family MFS transporter [Nonomuraea sp. NPDC049158]|uniref:MDR family MFS transporter n=1 Tax=Nonomuraea sp. NPDC049158 TaxID=3155649 RepID=UPI00341188DA
MTRRPISAVVGGLMAGMFLSALDQTIVSTSMRTIADDLHGLSHQAWVTTAYLIASTVTMPLYGKLSDLYGRKPLYLTAVAVFVAGSLLCATATSMGALAAFRAVQGLGAGGLMSLAFAIVADLLPPRERARYQGWFVAVFGLSSVLGPLAGGTLAEVGWRWVFLVNVPVGAAVLALVARTLDLPATRRERRLDWAGALPLMAGLVLASALSGRVIARSGRYKAFLVTGLALISAAALALSPLLDTDVPLIAVMGLAAVLGLGLGSSMQPLTLSVQAAAPVRDMGVATSAATFTRQLGGTAGIAGCVAVLFGRTGEIGDSSAMAASFAGSFAAAVRPVFLLVAILAAAGFLMALLIKELPLRTTTGPRARATEGITR